MFKKLIVTLVVLGLLLLPANLPAPTTKYGVGTDLPFLQWRVTKHASSVFDGATGSAHGDKDAANTYRIFTVTGDVIIYQFVGIVNTTLTEAGASAAIIVGATGNTGKLLSDPTSGATDLVDGDVWLDAGTEPSIDTFPGGAPTWGAVINDGADIVETTSSQDITGGQIDYYIIWAPLGPGATVVGAGTLSDV